VNAGRTAKGRHLEPRIVGEREHARGCRGGARLESGVLLERVAGLFRFGQTETTGGDASDAERREQFAELPDLALVVAGNDDPVTALEPKRHQATVSFCSATSSAMPPRASAMS